MTEQTNTPGVIAQARAAAPVSVPPAPAPAQLAPIEPVAQGFGAPTVPNGFATPQPEPQLAPVAPPAVQTDNDRTREQFEKLVDTNQRVVQQNEQLRQELLAAQRQRQQTNQQFEPVQQVPTQPQGQQPSALPKLSDYVEVDPQTGERFVNEARFNSAMADIYQKASRAEQVVQNYVQTAEQREVDRQEREAFSTYPQLNMRGEKFEKGFSQSTRAILYDSMINPQDYGGRPYTLKEAADFVAKGLVAPATPSASVSTPTVNEANQVQKEQAAATVPSTPQQVAQNFDTDREYQKLVMGTRTGSDEAIAVRLLNANHKLEDVEREAAAR